MYRTPHALASALLAASLVTILPAPAQGQVQPSNFAYEGYYQLQTNGADSSYMQGLTHRYVSGQLRFLYLTHTGVLQEFRLPAMGQTQTATTATWNLGGTGALNSHNGIWWEESKQRLWVTSAEDYTTVNHPAKVTLLVLGSGGAVSVQKQFFLNVPAKRVYGGCNAVPASLVAQVGGPYVCGWGGYTSLVAQGGGASMGPTMYAIPDPDTVANGATVAVRTILDTASSRGLRKTIPVNYFDGGDPRQNPSSRPTSPPLASASWLSPNAQGLGWFVWGDSYYNTGMWIGTTYAAIASLCKGACWYQNSTLHFDERQFELHLWNGAGLGNDPLKRPDSMTELNLPQGITGSWDGNVPQRNVAGATFDPVSGRAYLVMSPAGNDWSTGRLYSFVVNGAGGATPPPSGDSTSPSVSLTSPANGATASGTLTLTASASDNVGVAGVWFTVDNTTVGSEDTAAPYQTSWNSTTVSNGTHTVRAHARDAAGNVSTSGTISITVNNATADSIAPAVALSAPANNATVSGTVTVSATASDNVGVSSVQFQLNGVNLGSADTSAPYSLSWNTTGAGNGTHTLRAIARDAAGNTTTSGTRVVTVSNTSSDATAPTVNLTSPSNNSIVSNTVTVSANASDNVGVLAVQFTLNGVNLGSPDTSAPFSITWNTQGAANGNHTLRAVARDAAGNVRTSSARTVRVSNSIAAAPTPPPPAATPPPPPSSTCSSMRPAADWVCVNGNWLPPGMTAPSAPQAVVPPPPPPASSAGCSSVRPGADWVCVNGGWLPPGIASIAPPPVATTPPSSPAVPAPSPSVCSTIRPAADWVCYGGGWLPPSLYQILAGAGIIQPQPSAPPPSLSSGACSTPRPGASWVCRAGGWLPPGHPDAN